MGKRIRAQRKGSSPRYRVASHRFPGSNRMPRENGIVGEVTELIHSPVHTAPLARIKLPDGDTTLVVATEGLSIGSSASPLVIMYHLDQGTLLISEAFLKEPQSTILNYAPVTAAKWQDLPVIHAMLKQKLVTKFVSECHLVR